MILLVKVSNNENLNLITVIPTRLQLVSLNVKRRWFVILVELHIFDEIPNRNSTSNTGWSGFVVSFPHLVEEAESS